MEIKKAELKKTIGNIWEIVTVLKDCFEYAQYLHLPETEDESDYLNKSRDFKFMRHILWRMTIIDLSKLYSKSKKRDKFNLICFVNNLKRNQYFGQIGISNVIIEEWENRIIDNQKVIETILLLRDKFYAHKDSKIDNLKSLEISFQEIETLIILAEEIIKEIYSAAFNSHAEMRSIFFKRERFNVIKILAEEKNIRMKKFKRGN